MQAKGLVLAGILGPQHVRHGRKHRTVHAHQPPQGRQIGNLHPSHRCQQNGQQGNEPFRRKPLKRVERRSNVSLLADPTPLRRYPRSLNSKRPDSQPLVKWYTNNRTKTLKLERFAVMRRVVLFVLLQRLLERSKQFIKGGIHRLSRVIWLSHCSPPDEMKWLPSLPQDSLIVNVRQIVGYPDSIGPQENTHRALRVIDSAPLPSGLPVPTNCDKIRVSAEAVAQINLP